MHPPTNLSTLLLEVQAGVCQVTFNRPETKNAMNGAMLDELRTVFEWVANEEDTRVMVLKGSAGTFCAGADIKEMRTSRKELSAAQAEAALMAHNRRFGLLSRAADMLDIPTIAVIEGAALGGGFGLACVCDIVLAQRDAVFGLPETRLGLIPAQIAPFVVQRIGAMATRRLALTGARFGAEEAARLGLVDRSFETVEELATAAEATIQQILRCGPQANRVTKRLLRRLNTTVGDHVLDQAAHVFAVQSLSAEGREGTTAFAEKRAPNWTAASKD